MTDHYQNVHKQMTIFLEFIEMDRCDINENNFPSKQQRLILFKDTQYDHLNWSFVGLDIK